MMKNHRGNRMEFVVPSATPDDWGYRAPKGSSAKSHQLDELFAVNKVHHGAFGASQSRERGIRF